MTNAEIERLEALVAEIQVATRRLDTAASINARRLELSYEVPALLKYVQELRFENSALKARMRDLEGAPEA